MIPATIGIRRVYAMYGVAVVALLIAAAVVPHRAQAARGVRADFNGDGFDDLAIGAPLENVEITSGSISISIPDAGIVHILYGGPAGVTAGGAQVFSQFSLAAGQGAEGFDHFGSSLAIGDFDGDRYDDLAIGAPGEDLGAIVDAGVVHVIYGSALGLSGALSEVLSQPVIIARSGDQFGWALTAGNFNGDAIDDLIASAPWADCPVCGKPDTGVFVAFAGTVSGLDRLFERSYADPEALFGLALAAGDFNGDGCDDLAVGAPHQIPAGSRVQAAGVVWMTPGTCGYEFLFADTTVPPIQPWHQDVAGIAGVAEDGDAFGLALAAGDFDGDGFDDLAIGVPHEDLNTLPIFNLTRKDAGVVHVLYGGSNWLSASGSQLWSQSDLGEAPQSFDWFGRSLAAGDFNEDGRDDLAIGAPLESFVGAPHAGQVHVVYGTSSGLTTLFANILHQNVQNLGLDRDPNDAFGMTVSAGDFDGDGRSDLVVGVTGEDANTGLVHVVYGAVPSGASSRWAQSTPGVGDTSEPGDRFGGALNGSR